MDAGNVKSKASIWEIMYDGAARVFSGNRNAKSEEVQNNNREKFNEFNMNGEDMDKDKRDVHGATRSKILPLNTGYEGDYRACVNIITISDYDTDCRQIGDSLREGRITHLNFENCDLETGKRIIDAVAGMAYMIDANFVPIGANNKMLVPKDIKVMRTSKDKKPDSYNMYKAN